MAQPARIRYCPGCGGPNPDPAATSCRFCDGALVGLGLPDPRRTIRCSACAAAMPVGSNFCADCGAGLSDLRGMPAPGPCPACTRAMAGWGLAPTAARPAGVPLATCTACGGVWLPTESRLALVADASAQADGHDASGRDVHRRTLPSGTLAARVVYRRCPSCGTQMNRKNFGGCSGVLVDECRCGTFFDAGELEDVLAFVRSGGLRLTRQRETEELERRARAVANPMPPRPAIDDTDTLDGGLLGAFLRLVFGRSRW